MMLVPHIAFLVQLGRGLMEDDNLVNELMLVVAKNRMVRWGYDETLDLEEKENWIKERLKDQILRSDIQAIISHLADLLTGDVDGMPEPCQPIGCDHGYHLAGCVFAETESETDGCC